MENNIEITNSNKLSVKILSKKLDDKIYLNYLLQSLNINDLKQMCRDFELKGYSKLKKTELVDFILDSLAEEELKELLEQKELEIISNEIQTAIKIINDDYRETLSVIKIVNEKNHEIELLFKGFNWEVSSYLSITPENISDPERDCDCRIGSNMGFCSHFWVGFILSLKQNYFKISDWKLTVLPKNFETKISTIKISATTTSGVKSKESGKAVSMVNENSADFQLTKHINSRITVYEGEITKILKRESDFQGNVTIYYIISLKDVKFGPQLKKPKDYREEDTIKINDIKLRVSDNAYEKVELKVGLNVGDKITCSGGVNKDNFWGLILKRVTKLSKI